MQPEARMQPQEAMINSYLFFLIPIRCSLFGLIYRICFQISNLIDTGNPDNTPGWGSLTSTRFHSCMLSCVWFFVTPWTVAHQALLSMEFSRQAEWRGLPFPSPGDHPHPGIEPTSLASPALAGRFFSIAPPGKPIGRWVISLPVFKEKRYRSCLLMSRVSQNVWP